MKKSSVSRKEKTKKVVRGTRPSKKSEQAGIGSLQHESDEDSVHTTVSPRSEELWEDWGDEKNEDRGSYIAAQKSQVIMDMTIDGDLADNHRYARHNPSSGSGLGSRQASPHQPHKARTKGSAKRSRSATRADNQQPTNR